MIPNSAASFSIQDFIESLNNLTATSSSQERKASLTRVPLASALKSSQFVRASIGVFRDQNDHSLWKIEKSDGVDYIVRTSEYDVPKEKDWSAGINRSGDTVTLAYKQYPIQKFAKAEFKFDNAQDFASYLVAKASSNPVGFACGLLKTLPFEERLSLQEKFKIFRGK